MPVKLNPTCRAAIRDLYVAGDISTYEIAKQLKVSRGTVIRVAKTIRDELGPQWKRPEPKEKPKEKPPEIQNSRETIHSKIFYNYRQKRIPNLLTRNEIDLQIQDFLQKGEITKCPTAAVAPTTGRHITFTYMSTTT